MSHTLKQHLNVSEGLFLALTSDILSLENDHEDWQLQNQKHDLNAYKQMHTNKLSKKYWAGPFEQIPCFRDQRVCWKGPVQNFLEISEPSCRVSCKQIGRWPLSANPPVAQKSESIASNSESARRAKNLRRTRSQPKSKFQAISRCHQIVWLLAPSGCWSKLAFSSATYSLGYVLSNSAKHARKAPHARWIPSWANWKFQASNAIGIWNPHPLFLNSIVNTFFWLYRF